MSTDLSELAQVLNTSWYTLSNLTIDEQIARFSDSNEYKYTLGPLHPNTCIATVHAYKYDDTCTKISRKGDLLLGFAALECDVPAFNMTIGGTQHESLAVPALRCGEWRAALDGTFPIPMICLVIHEVRMLSNIKSNGLWAVYAFLNFNYRHAIADVAPIAHLEKVSWLFTHGMAGIVKSIPDKIVPMPLLKLSPEPPLEIMMARARERTSLLREELVRATWHPHRMRRWCLARDDEFAVA